MLRGLHVERKVSMAIKLLPPSVVQRPMGGNTFTEDVKKLQKLVHPNIMRYYGGAVDQGQPYLALELVQGESLRDRLDRRGKLPWEMTVEIVDGICQALVHAHQAGFVHQRLTPTRVLLPEQGGVKISGFECAWTDRDEVLGLRVPIEVGHYLSQETYKGKQSALLPTVDLFSLGVILYECLSGEQPWPVDSVTELVQVRRVQEAPRISSKEFDCPVWLDLLTSKLLAVRRKDRLQTAEEAHRAFVIAQQKAAAGTSTLQDAWSGKQGTVAPQQDRDELRRLRRRRKQADHSPFYERAWFLVLCLLAVFAVGAWVMWPLSEDALFQKAQPLMKSENVVDWKRAEEQYLAELRERFPDTKYAEQIRAFDERYLLYRAEIRVKNNMRLGRAAESEAERHYTEALEYERFGDRLSAWQRYEALIQLFSDSSDPYDRAYVTLARRNLAEIKSVDYGLSEQTEFVESHLDEAEALIEAGELLRARRILDSVVSLYGGNQELRPQVSRGRRLIERIRDESE